MAGSLHAFIRPLAMLAAGMAAGLVMWRVLMADDGHGHPVVAPTASAAGGGPLDPVRVHPDPAAPRD
jgi:hypothetical protein